MHMNDTKYMHVLLRHNRTWVIFIYLKIIYYDGGLFTLTPPLIFGVSCMSAYSTSQVPTPLFIFLKNLWKKKRKEKTIYQQPNVASLEIL